MSFDEKKKYGSMDKAFQAGKKDKAKTWNETIQGIVKAQDSSSKTARALSKPFIIRKDDPTVVKDFDQAVNVFNSM
jgi:3-methyladenine DNA glycosylase Tag